MSGGVQGGWAGCGARRTFHACQVQQRARIRKRTRASVLLITNRVAAGLRVSVRERVCQSEMNGTGGAEIAVRAAGMAWVCAGV
jgi:hypothetical protein